MDSSNTICARCTEIDFEDIFEQHTYWMSAEFILELGRPNDWDPSSCSVCRLFYELIHAGDGCFLNLDYHLWKVSIDILYVGPTYPGSILLFVAPNQGSHLTCPIGLIGGEYKRQM
jgi:hypothetical protein